MYIVWFLDVILFDFFGVYVFYRSGEVRGRVRFGDIVFR